MQGGRDDGNPKRGETAAELASGSRGIRRSAIGAHSDLTESGRARQVIVWRIMSSVSRYPPDGMMLVL